MAGDESPGGSEATTASAKAIHQTDDAACAGKMMTKVLDKLGEIMVALVRRIERLFATMFGANKG